MSLEKGNTMTIEGKLNKAMDLLNRANEVLGEHPPDSEYFRDFFLLTGEHVVRSDEGWEPGSCKGGLIDMYGEEAILGELNAPVAGRIERERESK